jgi:predicted HTH domain antitoxin
MRMSITFDLPDEISADVIRRPQRAGQTPYVFVAEALRRQLAIERFRETRESLAEYGRRADLQTDEDVFTAIS